MFVFVFFKEQTSRVGGLYSCVLGIDCFFFCCYYFAKGYKTLPTECDKILNPSGTGQPGDGNLGVVNFAATIQYTTDSAPITLTPESYSLNKQLQHRITTALALKIGATPNSLLFEQAVDGLVPNSIVVGVKLSNLKCQAGKHSGFFWVFFLFFLFMP